MARATTLWPLTTEVLGKDKPPGFTDTFPATYHYYEAKGKRAVGNPVEDTSAFLWSELSLGGLPDMLRHLWFAGAKRPAMPLHLHAAMGYEIVVSDRMDLHLLWTNAGGIFFKPVPRFLLHLAFCQSNLQCPDGCRCDAPADTCQAIPRKVALGFLYTYSCLIASETDFHIANEKRLLPRKEDDTPIDWADWKSLARELLRLHEHNPHTIHPRFLRAELRLCRINTIHRLTRFPRFDPYISGRQNYSSFFRDNFAWMAVGAVFVALVLTAMQVGLATERLAEDATFQQASYGFTVFAILGPLCVFVLIVIRALFHLIRDLPLLQRGQRSRTALDRGDSSANSEDAV